MTRRLLPATPALALITAGMAVVAANAAPPPPRPAHRGGNRIATIVAGSGVKSGQYPGRLDHYDLMHTLQRTYGLALTGEAARRNGMPDLWR